MSLPTVVGRSSVQEVLEIPLANEEADALHRSADAVQNKIRSLGYEIG